MKKVLILSRQDDRDSYDTKKTYSAALASTPRQSDYTVDEYETLLFIYDGDQLRILLSDGLTDIASFDAVFLVSWFKTKILEDVALSVSTYLHAKGVTFTNTEALMTRSRSKLSQYVIAALNGITLTPFIFSLDKQVLENAIVERWGHGYPVIMKGVQSNRGDDNYLLDSQERAVDVTRSTDSIEGPYFVMQSFVPNDGDYRIIVMGDSVTGAIHRRTQSDTHLNNTSKGGVATWIDPKTLPAAVVDQSVRLARLLHREVTGVDMIQHRDTGKFYLLEINNMPQMATGSYVQEKIAQLDTFLKDL